MATLKVPWSTSGDTTFEYKGRKIVVGKLVWNAVTERMSFSLTVGNRQFKGITLVSGVDLIQPFNTGLPPLYAFNVRVPLADPNPSNLLLVFKEA